MRKVLKMACALAVFGTVFALVYFQSPRLERIVRS